MLTLTVLGGCIGADWRLVLTVQSHLARVGWRIGSNISSPEGHRLKVIEGFVNS